MIYKTFWMSIQLQLLDCQAVVPTHCIHYNDGVWNGGRDEAYP